MNSVVRTNTNSKSDSAELETSTADFTQWVPDALTQTAWFWETIRRMKGRGSWLDSMRAWP